MGYRLCSREQLNRNPLPALQSLKIHGWLCCKPKDELMLLFDEAPIAWLAASLRHLSLTDPRTTSVNKLESLERFWNQVLLWRVLQPAVNLESLVITGNGGRNMVWEDHARGEGDMVPFEFIMRHQKTLKKLELHNCAINVRKRYGPPHCYWADIYKRLANALTGLVELKVEFKHKEEEIPYVYFGGHSYYSYLKKDNLKGRAVDVALAQDPLALEEFRRLSRASQGMGGGSGFRP
ncbi:hypothetical protein F5888DRAFT_1631792 [Russula emetica]|nr:hypothetical protein F5888DRAFT_1631792 [Russula emetica]